MRRNTSGHSHHDEKLKPSRTEDHGALRSRTEEERKRRRREWKIQQNLQSQHDKLKEKMILEYEIRRARKLGLPLPKGSTSHGHSRTKSRSRSPRSRHRRTSTSSVSDASERQELSSGMTTLFKGPEGTQISASELRRIKVDIHRNIPGKSASDELQRDIVNPEDVQLKRRMGEGSKPIFEREELKQAVGKTEEVEEHRTVVAVDNDNSEDKSKVYKKHSESSHTERTRNHSPRRTSSSHFRHEDSKHDDKGGSYRSDREKGHSSRDRSRDYRNGHKEKDSRHSQSRNVEEEHSRERKSRRDHSRSTERDHHSRSFKNERFHRDYRGRPRERSLERGVRERFGDLTVSTQHYIEQIPVPIYYGNFPPRPIMVGPLVPIRGQVPLGSSRHPPMMGPLRPFPPRFIPPDMYRLRPPPNPRFGPMY